MSLDYKILGQLYYGSETQIIPGTPGTPGYGYGYGYGSPGTPDQTITIIQPQAAYTVPSGKQAVVTSIFVTNHDVIERTYDLAIVPAGETLGIKHHIRWDMPVSSQDFDLISSKISLSAGDKVYVFPSTIDKVGFTVFGVEM